MSEWAPLGPPRARIVVTKTWPILWFDDYEDKTKGAALNNPKTLVERLRHRAIPWNASMTNDGSPAQVWRGPGEDDPLLVEAANRIDELERSIAFQRATEAVTAHLRDTPTEKPPWECRRCGQVFESVRVHFCVPL